MMKRILQLMFKGNSCTLSNLATNLDVSEKLLIQMLNDLVHQDCIRQFDVGSPQGGCARCSRGINSESATKFKGWELTEIGKIAANVIR